MPPLYGLRIGVAALGSGRGAGGASAAPEGAVRGSGEAIEGWLIYGAALNEGRALFPSDEQFGQWAAEAVSDKLSVTPNDHERAAAMWAAEDRERFEEVRAVGSIAERKRAMRPERCD